MKNDIKLSKGGMEYSFEKNLSLLTKQINSNFFSDFDLTTGPKIFKLYIVFKKNIGRPLNKKKLQIQDFYAKLNVLIKIAEKLMYVPVTK